MRCVGRQVVGHRPKFTAPRGRHCPAEDCPCPEEDDDPVEFAADDDEAPPLPDEWLEWDDEEPLDDLPAPPWWDDEAIDMGHAALNQGGER